MQRYIALMAQARRHFENGNNDFMFGLDDPWLLYPGGQFEPPSIVLSYIRTQRELARVYYEAARQIRDEAQPDPPERDYTWLEAIGD